ncbi:MAG: hypothetical protein Q8K52_03510 [Thiobacillus sp.]|nr:hypothetical protein [Thiobacillus sp.]
MKKNLINFLLSAVLTLTMHLPSSAAPLPHQEAEILKLVELALGDESGRDFIRSFALFSGQRVDDEMLRGLYVKPEREVDSLRILLIGEVVTKKVRLPEALVLKAIKHRSTRIRAAIAYYPYLNESQVEALILTRDANIGRALLENPHITVKERDMDSLIDSVLDLNSRELNLMIASGQRQLTKKQVDQLESGNDLLIKLFLALRKRDGSEKQAMMALIHGKNEGDISRAIGHYRPLPEEVVDMMLNQPNPAVRRYLTMQGAFTPTPRQVDAIVGDADPSVSIGLLRRRDVVLSPEQVNRGINHTDENVARQFRSRDEFHPTPEQNDAGLTSTAIMTRLDYAQMKKITPTKEQVERGLMDSEQRVRLAFLARRDITLTEPQLDRCTVDRVIPVRRACVERLEYLLNQARFETILLDENPFVFTTFTHGSKADTALEPFVWAALRGSTVQVQVALARNNRVQMTDEQIQFGLNSKNYEVHIAFCGRFSVACGNR